MDLEAKLIDLPSAGKIALIATAKDEVGEAAFKNVMEQVGVDIFTTRTVYTDDEPDENGNFHFVTPFNEVAKAFPDTDRLDILAFSCTSGTVATGKDRILEKLQDARPGLKYTTPGIGALNALKHGKFGKIALLTPYPHYMHNMFIDFFDQYGISVTSHGTFNTDENDIGRISPADLLNASRRLLAEASCDALYISCTAVNVLPHIEWLEAEIGVPVLASSQVLAWDCLKLLDIPTRLYGFGSIFRD